MFEELFRLAKNEITGVEEKVVGLPAPQITVLLTDKNQYYTAVNDIDGFICEELRNKKDTKIVQMLTMWKDGCVDVPSIQFRRALVELDEFNYDTDIVLEGKNGYFVKKLAKTIL